MVCRTLRDQARGPPFANPVPAKVSCKQGFRDRGQTASCWSLCERMGVRGHRSWPRGRAGSSGGPCSANLRIFASVDKGCEGAQSQGPRSEQNPAASPSCAQGVSPAPGPSRGLISPITLASGCHRPSTQRKRVKPGAVPPAPGPGRTEHGG